MPNTSSAFASLWPARDTYGGGASPSSSMSSATCSPGFEWPGTRPAITSACACARDSARPRSTSSTSSRFLGTGTAGRDDEVDGGEGRERSDQRVRSLQAGVHEQRPCDHERNRARDVVDCDQRLDDLAAERL